MLLKQEHLGTQMGNCSYKILLCKLLWNDSIKCRYGRYIPVYIKKNNRNSRHPVFEWQLNPFLFSPKIGLDLQKSKSTETDLILYSKTNRQVQTPSAVSHSGQMPTSALLIVEPWIFNEPLSPFRIEEQKKRRSRSSQFQYSWITVFALFSPCFHYLHLLQFIFICE